MQFMIHAGVRVESCAFRRAARAATWGVAMEVPLRMRVPLPSESVL